MKYLPHQLVKSDECYTTLKRYGVCLLAGLPRTGKTRTAIRVAEMSKAKHILVITRKAAIEGWHSELEAVTPNKQYTVTNYEQVKNLTGDSDLIIVDESHNIGRAGKPTQRLKDLKRRTKGKPVMLLTGTPAAESLLSYYYQFSLSNWSPFQHRTFYDFFREWGVPNLVRISGRFQETYTKGKEDILPHIQHLIVTLTQEQAGIKHQAQDKVHTVPLAPATKQLIDEMQEHKIIKLDGEQIPFESEIGERFAVHQVEYGALLVGDKIIKLDNSEVIDYIYETFGDSDDIGLMCHFRSTLQKLQDRFKKAHLYSSNAHSEGVNLAHLKHFIIVNSDYSGAKFIQRRERITNIMRETEAVVHHIVTDYGISAAVYDKLKDKQDFTLRQYRYERAGHTEEDH